MQLHVQNLKDVFYLLKHLKKPQIIKKEKKKTFDNILIQYVIVENITKQKCRNYQK